MNNDNAFVRGIKRAVEQRKRREQQAAEHSVAAVAVNDCSQANADEAFRIDLVNKIITHIRKNRKEPTQ